MHVTFAMALGVLAAAVTLWAFIFILGQRDRYGEVSRNYKNWRVVVWRVPLITAAAGAGVIIFARVWEKTIQAGAGWIAIALGLFLLYVGAQ